jgi:hypothetical protein
MKAAACGITMAAASALATDALAQAPSPPGKAAPPATGRAKPQVQTKIEVRIPDTIRLSKGDLDAITAEFNNKLVELIKRRGGGGGAELKPTKRVQTVTEEKAIEVDVQ